MELLKEEISNDHIPYKVNAVHRLTTVILAIGPSQTNGKLIPFLGSNFEQLNRFNSKRRR